MIDSRIDPTQYVQLVHSLKNTTTAQSTEMTATFLQALTQALQALETTATATTNSTFYSVMGLELPQRTATHQTAASSTAATSTTTSTTSSSRVNDTTLQWRQAIATEMKKQGVDGKWLNLLLAHVMQESGGRADLYPDIFQASESLGLAPNSISTATSIKQGVKVFKQELAQVKQITGHDPSPTSLNDVNISTVLYNAPAFGPWLKQHYQGKWSVQANNDFYDKVLPQYGVGNGDRNYWQHILNYYDHQTGFLK